MWILPSAKKIIAKVVILTMCKVVLKTKKYHKYEICKK